MVLEKLREACQASGIKPTTSAMSWLVNHSKLEADRGDGIILGVSKIEHLAENIAACAEAPLDQSILDILDEGWEIIKPDCLRYFRP